MKLTKTIVIPNLSHFMTDSTGATTTVQQSVLTAVNSFIRVSSLLARVVCFDV